MLPNFTFNPYVKPYVGGVANELGQVVQAKTQQFYQLAEADDVLGYQADTLKNLIMDNPNDQAYADQILNQTRGELADRSQRGDYENMFREVKRSARKFTANVTPLLQRKQQYDTYLKQMSEEMGKGTFGRDTYNRAIQYSKDNDKGYDPKNPTTIAFRGFQPTKDESAAEIANKFLGNDFKGSKTVREFYNPYTMSMDKVTMENSGEYAKASGKTIYIDKDGQTNIEEKGRPVTRIELAVRQHLNGNKDFQNYTDTQSQLGNLSRVNSEVNSAVQAEVQKLGINIDMREKDISGIPAWLKFREDKLNESKAPETGVDVITPNNIINPYFQGSLFSADGHMRASDNDHILDKDGNYTKYLDKNGSPVTVGEALTRMAKLGTEYKYSSPEVTATAAGLQHVKLSAEEQAKIDKVNDTDLTKMAQNVYIAKANALHVTPEQRDKILVDGYNTWNSLKFKKEVVEGYNKDIEASRNIAPEEWSVKDFPNVREIAEQSIGKSKDGNAISRNLLGRPVTILGKDAEYDISQQSQDGDNSFDKVVQIYKDKGYAFKDIIAHSLLKVSPTGVKDPKTGRTIPAMSATMTFEDDKHNIKKINVAVGISDADKKPLLQTLQDVGELHHSGRNGGDVRIGKYAQKFRLINVPGSELGAPGSMVGFVTQIDENGNKTPFIDNNGREVDHMTINDWQDWFINQPAVREEANKFLLNK